MPTIRDIYNVLFDFAPAYMKMDWDNVGLVCGKFDTEVHRILVALDPMMDVFEEAKALSCELRRSEFAVPDRKRHREPESAHES